MACLLDTSVLLRLIDRKDPMHSVVVNAVTDLRIRGISLVTSTQNLAELWNVLTRPIANNGLGVSSAAAVTSIERVVEPLCSLAIETDQLFPTLKSLAQKYDFGGKQVHDARLVALLLSCQIDSILTLNERHFLKYKAEGIQVLVPNTTGTP